MTTMTYSDVVEHEFCGAIETEALVQRTMDSYWTPFEGHKVNRTATVQKWHDFLLVAQSGQRTAMSDKCRELWFRLECQVAYDLKCF
jgi:hypothetical protein